MDLPQVIPEEYIPRAVLDLSLRSWILLLLVWAAVTAALILLQRLLNWRFSSFAQRTPNLIDDAAAELIKRTHVLFIAILGLYLAVLLIGLPARVVAVVGRLTFLALLVQVVRWGNNLISLWIDRYREQKLEIDAAAVTTVQAVGFVGRLLLFSVVLLLALDNFGIDVTAMIATLGVGGIAVALAVQNILGDLFASLSIVLDKPFVVGDFLIIGEYLGTVEHVGLKTTRIRSLSGEQIVFSNSDLLKSRIRNYKRMFERRVVFTFGITYQTPYEKVAALPGMLREIIEAQDQVRFDRAHFKEYGDFALKFEVVYYVLAPDYNLYMDIQQQINLGIFQRLEEEKIDFAYPTQRLFLEGMTTESVDGGSRA